MARAKGGVLREEVYNIHLATFLREEYLNAIEERRTPRGAPDIIVNLDGPRVFIEAKYEAAGVERILYEQTQKRMEGDSFIAAVMEVVYPAALRAAAVPDKKLRAADLRYRIRLQTGEVRDWQKGKPPALADALYALRDSLDTPKRLQEAVQIMTDAVGEAALELGSRKADGERIAGIVNVRDVESGRKIAALMVVNALIFQSHLAGSESSVAPLGGMSKNHRKVAGEWHRICDEINYVPIFRTAANVLGMFPDGRPGQNIFARLVRAAEKINDIRGHDLAGRVFHKIVDFAKPRAAYYTSLPAASLLAALAFDRKFGGTLADVDWGSPAAVGKLRIADLACGTGTLLLAAAREIERLHRNVCGGKNKSIKPHQLHRVLMEKVMHGYDVELIAVHLAAAHLGLLSPTVAFDRMNLYALPCGEGDNGDVTLGSANFLFSDKVEIQHDLVTNPAEARRVTGEGEERATAHLPALDLAIINPPFSRSMGSNQMFGDMPPQARQRMQKALGRDISRHNISASTSAGLGAVILAAAAKRLRHGGRLAAVLPAALCTGDAWRKTRHLLAGVLRLDAVVLSHDAARTNFSESTSLSECLVVATRRTEEEEKRNHNSSDTVFVHLLRNPKDELDATRTVRLLRAALGKVRPTSEIRNDAAIYRKKSAAPAWQRTRFAWPRLADDAEKIMQCPAVLPLAKLVDIGPDVRRVYDGFEEIRHRTEYAAFWSHKTEERRTMTATPNLYLSPIHEPRKQKGTMATRGRDKDYPDRLWGWGSGRLCVASTLRLNTVRTLAVLVDKPVLANSWWPLRLKKKNEDALRALTAWFNSSFGAAAFLWLQTPTQGAWTSLKNRPLQQFPIPNLNRKTVVARLAAAFAAQKDSDLAPLPNIESDETRIALDEACAAAVKGLPDAETLRRRIAAEPFVKGKTAPRP
ncbi:MAG: hypothetical protein OXE47_00985 [Gammaproteobacteria bacterium]|nr:hypothetical protein [Gammaproteobacteria bacterium]